MKVVPLIVSICLLFAFCDSSKTIDDPLVPDDKAELKTVVAFPNLTFRRPVDLQQPNDQSNRLFVVEQAGIISVFQRDAQTSTKKTFLDITARVDDGGNEEGLLGLAFHPQYKSNGFFY